MSYWEAGWVQHIEEGRNEVQKLTNILNGLRKDVDYAKNYLEKERQQHYCTQQRLKSAYTCVESMKSELASNDSFVSKVQNALSNSNAKVVQQQQQIDQMQACLCQWQDEAVNLKTALTKALTDQSQSEEESCRKTEEIKKLHVELSRLKCEKDIREHESLSHKKTLESELSRSNFERCRLTEELNKLKQSRGSVHQMVKSSHGKNEENSQLKSLICDLQLRFEAKEKEMQAINCYNKQLEDLIKEKNSQLLRTATTMDNVEKELKRAQHQITCLTKTNSELQCSSDQQNEELRRLQDRICELQKQQHDQELSSSSAWEDSQTQKCLEAQRKLTYTLVHQLNEAQAKVYQLCLEKGNLEKFINELKTLNCCLTEELKQKKGSLACKEMDSDTAVANHQALRQKLIMGGDCQQRRSSFKLDDT